MLTNSIFEDQFLNQFLRFKFQDPTFRSQKISSKSQKVKEESNLFLTKHGVLWIISKVTKIRGLGMEFQFLCYVSKYVTMVWGFILRWVFVFQIWDFFGKSF